METENENVGGKRVRQKLKQWWFPEEKKCMKKKIMGEGAAKKKYGRGWVEISPSATPPFSGSEMEYS